MKAKKDGKVGVYNSMDTATLSDEVHSPGQHPGADGLLQMTSSPNGSAMMMHGIQSHQSTNSVIAETSPVINHQHNHNQQQHPTQHQLQAAYLSYHQHYQQQQAHLYSSHDYSLQQQQLHHQQMVGYGHPAKMELRTGS